MQRNRTETIQRLLVKTWGGSSWGETIRRPKIGGVRDGVRTGLGENLKHGRGGKKTKAIQRGVGDKVSMYRSDRGRGR